MRNGLKAKIIIPLTTLPSASCAARPATTAITPPAVSNVRTALDSSGILYTTTITPAKYTAATAT